MRKSYFRLNWFSDEMYYAVNEKLFYVTGLCLYLNATINPIVIRNTEIYSYLNLCKRTVVVLSYHSPAYLMIERILLVMICTNCAMFRGFFLLLNCLYFRSTTSCQPNTERHSEIPSAKCSRAGSLTCNK